MSAGPATHAVSDRTELAIRPLSDRLPPFGLRTDLVALDQVLIALEHGHGPDRDLDAAIYAALGWQITGQPFARRRIAWRCRSPLSTGWEALPYPTASTADAAQLVPYGWDWSAGVVNAQPRAWCRERRPREGSTMPRYSECNRLTVPRALASAALFAQRQIAMGDRRHG